MNNSKPDLTTTEVRQGNNRKMNLRVLIIGIVVVAIGFAVAIWYNASVTPDTDTTVGGGTTLEDAPAPDSAPASNLENLPTPAPVEQTAPAAPDAEAIIEDAAPAQ